MVWPPLGVTQRLIDLHSIRDSLRGLNGSDFFVEQCLARYLTVRSAGYLEAVRDDVSDQFSAAQASPRVVNRVREHLRTGQGVTPGQLLSFVATFDPEWKSELEEVLDADDGLLRSSLGAMVKARKLIAHGDGETVTAGRALKWSETSETLGAWLIARFDPTSGRGMYIREGA